MTSDGLVVTNAHVAGGAAAYMVTVNGRSRPIPAQLWAIAECEDLAVLRLTSGSPFSTLSWSENAPYIGLQVGAAGFPSDVSTTESSVLYTYTVGNINTATTQDGTTWSSADVFTHGATIYGGSSGGPLVETAGGTVVGVNYARSGTGRSEALSSITARGIVDRLLAGKDVLAIGISGEVFYQFFDASKKSIGYGFANQKTSQVASSAPYGVWVRGVAPRSKASLAGILPGDVITVINGRPLNADPTMNAYCNVLRSNDPNANFPMKFEIVRPKAGYVSCEGEINGHVIGKKGAPNTACPETALSSNGTYAGQVGTPGSDLYHDLSLQIKDGVISGTSSWLVGSASVPGSVTGTISPTGAVVMTEKVVYQRETYLFTYAGTYDATTRRITGRATAEDGYSEDWSVGGQQ